MKNDIRSEFRGNKAQLPSKLCVACGRTMTWRKAWAKNWEQVKFCSDRCRVQKNSLHKTATSQAATDA